jgi:hypothetical protein
MVKLPTLLLGTTLGITALGLSATASAGVAVGVGIGLPVPAPAVVAVPADSPLGIPSLAARSRSVTVEPVAYAPGRYYGPHFYARVPYHGPYFGPAYVHPRAPVGVWHPGFAARGGYWRR